MNQLVKTCQDWISWNGCIEWSRQSHARSADDKDPVGDISMTGMGNGAASKDLSQLFARMLKNSRKR